MNRAALISDCQKYRYWLTRGGPGRRVAFVMLNPSTADGTDDDPTIRRCWGYASFWGFHELAVVNLYAYRSTDPAALRSVADPVGPDNARHQRYFVKTSALTVCAWGANANPGAVEDFVRRVREFGGPPLYCLGTTAAGQPRHPLYMPARITPTLWSLDHANT